MLDIVIAGASSSRLYCDLSLDADVMLIRPLRLSPVTTTKDNEAVLRPTFPSYAGQLYVRASSEASLLAIETLTLMCAGHGLGSFDTSFDQWPESREAYGHYAKSRFDVGIEGKLASILEEHDARFEASNKCKPNQRDDAASSTQQYEQVSPELCHGGHVQVTDGTDRK